MSYVTMQPELLIAAAGTFSGLGSELSAHNVAAAAPTIGIVAPAADEISGRNAAYLVQYAQSYQTVSAQAAAICRQFVATLTSNAGSYADTEAASAIAASLGSA